MNYYKGNAIYDYINANQLTDFKFCSGNLWQLVYGDSNCVPKLLALVIGADNNGYNAAYTPEQIEAFDLLNTFATTCNLPIKVIKFNTDVEIENILISDDVTVQPTEITLADLRDIFSQNGLPVSDTSTAKYLNDRTSSAYHKWQRGHLGRALTVSDIDLWKLTPTGAVQRIYELKRSYIAIGNWNPYPDDYRNFRLLSAIANQANVRLGIVYNVRKTKPKFHDDISSIKVFKVDFTKTPPIKIVGIYKNNGFFNL
tara:strand:+ start:59 stop:826 length:768 start_codon:yes stop_codon:yes gene_type:complete